MPIYTIHYDVRYTDGSIEIQAENPVDATMKFAELPIEELVDGTCDIDVDIEEILDDAGTPVDD